MDKMSDEKLFEDNEFDDQFELAELDDLYEGDKDFDSFEGLDDVPEEAEPSSDEQGEQSERRWLTLGFVSLFLAVLFRF